jgi:hypothetical protein
MAFQWCQITFVFPIRQAVPVGLPGLGFCCWARWARIFIEKKKYYSKYSKFTYNLLFSKCLGRREWVDGVGSVWMTTSQLGKRCQLGSVFGAGLAGLGFP